MDELLKVCIDFRECIERFRDSRKIDTGSGVYIWKLGTPTEIMELERNPVWVRFCAAIENARSSQGGALG